MQTNHMNRSLHAAKATKQDEFYTQLSDIEKELVHYQKHFKNQTVLCNCDDPRISNFFKYFINNFEKLGLKKNSLAVNHCRGLTKRDMVNNDALPRIEVAAELGATANQVVLAWLIGGTPAITPLVGVSSAAQLDEALAGARLTLGDDQRRRLDAAA